MKSCDKSVTEVTCQNLRSSAEIFLTKVFRARFLECLVKFGRVKNLCVCHAAATACHASATQGHHETFEPLRRPLVSPQIAPTLSRREQIGNFRDTHCCVRALSL